MKELRELVIAILYLIIPVPVVCNVKNIIELTGTEGIVAQVIITLTIGLVMFAFSCLPLSIYHIIKLLKYNRKFSVIHTRWTYEPKEWRSFVRSNTLFRIVQQWRANIKVVVYTITILSLALVFKLISSGEESIKPYVMIIPAVIFIFMLWPVVKGLLFFTENIIFSQNAEVLIGDNCISINGDFYYWNERFSKWLRNKREFNNEIEYELVSNDRVLGETVVKIRIPIPRSKIS